MSLTMQELSKMFLDPLLLIGYISTDYRLAFCLLLTSPNCDTPTNKDEPTCMGNRMCFDFDLHSIFHSEKKIS